MARGSVSLHKRSLASHSEWCLLPRGFIKESLSLSRGTGWDLDLTGALREHSGST